MEAGTIIEGYRLIRHLGDGGMASVWQAEHRADGRLVAIKLPNDELARDKDFRRRFFDEGQHQSTLDHPNVVQVFSILLNPLALVMEFVDGGTLAQELRRGLPSRDRVRALMGGITAGVGAAHQQGIIHRDLKPLNVLLTQDGQPKVADFGLARVGGTRGSTRPGVALGTPKFMSPEQIQGSSEVDVRTDVYALGVLLYRMLAGRVPFVGSGDLQIAYAHIHHPPPDPRQFVPDLPMPLVDLLSSALAKHPDDRPADALDLGRLVEEAFDLAESAMPGASDDEQPHPAEGGWRMPRATLISRTTSFNDIDRIARPDDAPEKTEREPLESQAPTILPEAVPREASEEPTRQTPWPRVKTGTSSPTGDRPSRDRVILMVSLGMGGALIAAVSFLLLQHAPEPEIEAPAEPKILFSPRDTLDPPDSAPGMTVGSVGPVAPRSAVPASVAPATDAAKPPKVETVRPKVEARKEPEVPAPSKPGLVEAKAESAGQGKALLAEAGAHASAGRWLEARARYQAALEVDAGNATALAGLSEVAFQQEQFEEAVRQGERATKAAPRNADYQVRLGMAYFKLSRHPEARKAWQRALTLSPGHPTATKYLDIVNQRLGEKEPPKAAAQAAEGAQDYQELMAQAVYLIAQGRREESVGALLKAHRLNPGAHMPHQRLCAILPALERTADALTHCKLWRAKEPNRAYRARADSLIAQLEAEINP